MSVKRIFVEKKAGFDTEAAGLLGDVRGLGINGITGLRLVNVYDCEGLSGADFEKCRDNVFSEPPVDNLFLELPTPNSADGFMIAVKYLPGQFSQRADSAEMCVRAVTGAEDVRVECFKLYICDGVFADDEWALIKKHLINPVDSMEASLDVPEAVYTAEETAAPVGIHEGFTGLDDNGLAAMRKALGLAMSFDDLAHCQKYFREEGCDPSETEIKVIDTYWSDHCRHTTFLTKIIDVSFEDGSYKELFEKTYRLYLDERKKVYIDREKNISLMDIATMGMKSLKRQGLLADLDESEEINACSINISVDVDGETEEWLLMFKNETHNHPTEIEPYGGAATCLGGAIRDPLSGRAYVYQAMRVTGSGDPRAAVSKVEGRLPQRKISQTAALGYSSYGNQIGVATGAVTEIYDEGYIAKRMEVGAVIGAVKKENVVRERPKPGDLVVLTGGRTGRDGCGGATGSSKGHDESSILSCGAEVQKGNPPTERKLQRLFRNPEAARLIKRCNDFGAGGVSVAIGELADSLEIDLDKVPKKYGGLSGTELAISESQERMAVVLSPGDVDKFIALAEQENLEATVVAEVTDTGRLVMLCGGKEIVNLSRDFLNTNGAEARTSAIVATTDKIKLGGGVKASADTLLNTLAELNCCCQKGLAERFDSTVGGLTVLMPFGGVRQLTPAQAMAARIPVESGKTTTASLMAFGYNPKFARQSPYHSAVYAVVESLSKIVASGGSFDKTRLSFQEYFESLGADPRKWGKPFSALLGAFYAQMMLGVPSIGGKDSMSGTFKELNVPPTLISFAVTAANEKIITSPELKSAGNRLYLIKTEYDEYDLPRFDKLKDNFRLVNRLITEGKILSAYALANGGIAAAAKLCFGNNIGMKLYLPEGVDFTAETYGSFIVEAGGEIPEGILIGETTGDGMISVGGSQVSIEEALRAWVMPLEEVFPTGLFSGAEAVKNAVPFDIQNHGRPAIKTAKPTVFVPVFPGTNCEYETIRAYEDAGAEVISLVMRNYSRASFDESVRAFADAISRAQIISIPGGFSAGDEPDGSGKFIAAVFRSGRISDAVSGLLDVRGGLMMGICNGFQALIKLGLLPTGKISAITENSPTLCFNAAGRHISCLAKTKITSKLSPWLSLFEPGEINSIAASHSEGRFIASADVYAGLEKNGQIAAQYVDFNGNASMSPEHNLNGSMFAVEAITSPDGRVMGKMAHNERYTDGLFKNVPGNKMTKLFVSGVKYFS